MQKSNSISRRSESICIAQTLVPAMIGTKYLTVCFNFVNFKASVWTKTNGKIISENTKLLYHSNFLTEIFTLPLTCFSTFHQKLDEVCVRWIGRSNSKLNKLDPTTYWGAVKMFLLLSALVMCKHLFCNELWIPFLCSCVVWFCLWCGPRVWNKWIII